MKLKITFAVLLIVFINIIGIQYLSASVMMDCTVKSKIIKVYSENKIQVLFQRIIYRGGHHSGHNFFDDRLLDQTRDIEITYYDEKLKEELKEGNFIYIRYSEASGPSGKGGFFHSINYELVNMPAVEELNQLNLTPKKKDKLYGYVNEKGKFIIKAKYTEARKFNENGYAYTAIGDKWYFINKKGEVILTPYTIDGKPDPFINNRARYIDENNKFGMYNDCGEIVYYPSYDYLFPYDNGYIISVQGCKLKRVKGETIVEGGRWGMLSDNGYLSLNNDFKKVFPIRDDRIKVINNQDEYEYYNSFGSHIDKMDTRELIIKEKDGKYGFVNEKGKFVIKAIYNAVQDFGYKNVTSVLDKDGWHIINKDGKKLFKPFLMDNFPEEYINGYARFVKDGKFGVYNDLGEVVVEAKYDFVDFFEYGYYLIVNKGSKAVKYDEYTRYEGGKWGLISIYDNEEIVPIKYKSVSYTLEDGKIQVTDFNNKTMYYNFKGKIVK